MSSHFWSETGFGGPKWGYPFKKVSATYVQLLGLDRLCVIYVIESFLNHLSVISNFWSVFYWGTGWGTKIFSLVVWYGSFKVLRWDLSCIAMLFLSNMFWSGVGLLIVLSGLVLVWYLSHQVCFWDEMGPVLVCYFSQTGSVAKLSLNSTQLNFNSN